MNNTKINGPLITINIYNLKNISGNLIFDRNQGDVDYASYCVRNNIYVHEDLKGAYNASDRNRIFESIRYLKECVRSYGIFEAREKTRGGWDEYCIASKTDNNNILRDLNYFKGIISGAQTPEVPANLDSLSYIKANILEKILFDLYNIFIGYAEFWLYCGEEYLNNY